MSNSGCYSRSVMKKDERLIEKALLKLKESESDVDFPNREDKNKEIANRYYTPPTAKTMTVRKRNLAVAAVCALMLIVTGVVAGIYYNSDIYYIRDILRSTVTIGTLKEELKGDFKVLDAIGHFEINDTAVLYKNGNGKVLFSELQYSDNTHSENVLDLTLISVKRSTSKIFRQDAFEDLLTSGIKGTSETGYNFCYILSTVDGKAYANIDMGNDRFIWVLLGSDDLNFLFDIIDQITAD